MSSFSLTNDTDRDALIAALKERGIEAFRFGATTSVCAIVGGGSDVIAYAGKGGLTRVFAAGPDAPSMSYGDRVRLKSLSPVLDTFAALFSLLEQGDAGRYAAKASSEAAT